MIGIGMNFLELSPIKALFWSAVLNGIVALPVMAIMMIMTANRTIMGKFPVTGVLKLLGWPQPSSWQRRSSGWELRHLWDEA
jgi:Mn2+/Fe2+ NRAMP family transporter